MDRPARRRAPREQLTVARTIRTRLITIPGRIVNRAGDRPYDSRRDGPGPRRSSPRSNTCAQATDLFDDAEPSPTTRIDVMTMTGEARRRVGDPSHREVLLEARRLAEELGNDTRMATAALANGRGWQSDTNGIDTERVAALEAAVRALIAMDTHRLRAHGSVPWPALRKHVLQGPTEGYMAGIAPLADHPDDLDQLLGTALRASEVMRLPVLEMYARLYGACGLRLRDRTGDHDQAARLVDESIDVGDRIGAGIARAAAENFPALTR